MGSYTEAQTSRFIEVDGVNIHYHEAGSGAPVILLHGSGPGASGWSNFNRNIDALAADFRVLCVDLPGWGKSDPRAKGVPLISWFAERMVGLMDKLDLPSAHMVGNSLGGAVSAKIALDQPDRVNKLVVMGAPLGHALFGDTFPPAIVDILTFYEGDGPTLEKLQAFVDKFVYDASVLTDELLQQRLETAMAFVDNPPMRIGPGDQLEQIWQHPGFPSLAHEVLMIWGREDKVVPLDRGLSVLNVIPNARLYVLPKCGHWAQWEHADEFNNVVGGFLRG